MVEKISGDPVLEEGYHLDQVTMQGGAQLAPEVVSDHLLSADQGDEAFSREHRTQLLVDAATVAIAAYPAYRFFDHLTAPVDDISPVATRMLMDRGFGSVDQALFAVHGAWPVRGLDIAGSNSQVMAFEPIDIESYPKSLGNATFSGSRVIQLKYEDDAATLAHEAAHILQGDHSNRLRDVFGEAVAGRTSGVGLKLVSAQDAVADELFVRADSYDSSPPPPNSRKARDNFSYSREGTEIQARIGGAFSQAYKVWGRYPTTPEELYVALESVGHKMPKEIATELSRSPTVEQTRSVFVKVDIPESRVDLTVRAQNSLPPEMHAPFWKDVLEPLYVDLVNMYGDRKISRNFGYGENPWIEHRRSIGNIPGEAPSQSFPSHERPRILPPTGGAEDFPLAVRKEVTRMNAIRSQAGAFAGLALGGLGTVSSLQADDMAGAAVHGTGLTVSLADLTVNSLSIAGKNIPAGVIGALSKANLATMALGTGYGMAQEERISDKVIAGTSAVAVGVGAFKMNALTSGIVTATALGSATVGALTAGAVGGAGWILMEAHGAYKAGRDVKERIDAEGVASYSGDRYQEPGLDISILKGDQLRRYLFTEGESPDGETGLSRQEIVERIKAHQYAFDPGAVNAIGDDLLEKISECEEIIADNGSFIPDVLRHNWAQDEIDTMRAAMVDKHHYEAALFQLSEYDSEASPYRMRMRSDGLPDYNMDGTLSSVDVPENQGFTNYAGDETFLQEAGAAGIFLSENLVALSNAVDMQEVLLSKPNDPEVVAPL
ncbi:MAG: hypothetical protein ACLFP8_00320 [Alphaproteobacteria bacterium]